MLITCMKVFANCLNYYISRFSLLEATLTYSFSRIARKIKWGENFLSTYFMLEIWSCILYATPVKLGLLFPFCTSGNWATVNTSAQWGSEWESWASKFGLPFCTPHERGFDREKLFLCKLMVLTLSPGRPWDRRWKLKSLWGFFLYSWGLVLYNMKPKS